jgi:6-phosphofructokinase 1
MSGIATGAERVYLNEERIVLKSLLDDLDDLVSDFKSGKKLGLLIRNEYAHHAYTTDFMCSMFEVEGGELFDVRQAILGHLQQGGNPSPFDRILATRFATKCMEYLIEQATQQSAESAFIGLQSKEYKLHKLEDFSE